MLTKFLKRSSHTEMLEQAAEPSPIRAIPTALKSGESGAASFSPEDDGRLLILIQHELSADLWDRLGKKFHQKKEGPSVRQRAVELMRRGLAHEAIKNKKED